MNNPPLTHEKSLLLLALLIETLCSLVPGPIRAPPTTPVHRRRRSTAPTLRARLALLVDLPLVRDERRRGANGRQGLLPPEPTGRRGGPGPSGMDGFFEETRVFSWSSLCAGMRELTEPIGS